MISKFSVKKPFTIFVSVILVLILGIVSFGGMKTDLLPKIELPFVMVITAYPGATPEKVELEVTKPLEKVLSTTSGVDKINSVSRENSSMIMVQFSSGINMDSAIIDLNSKLDLVKSNLGETVQNPMIMKMDPDMLPIMIATVDVKGLEGKELSEYVKNEVIPSLERTDGVASVDPMGLLEEKIKITLDEEKIDEINNKVLRSIDSGLADGEAKLNKAKSELKAGKKKLEEESLKKTEELVSGGIALGDGKNKLEEALKDLPKLKTQLEAQKKDLIDKKTLLEKLIKWQEESNIPVVDEEKEALNQFNQGIAKLEEAISDIDSQKPTLESKLKELQDAEKNIEVGKLVLNQELSKMSSTLATSEAELNKAEKEMEKAREEAYKKANLGATITKENVAKLIMAQNFAMPAGYIEQGNEKFAVKVGDKISQMEELENLVLFNVGAAGIGEIKLSDIAKVEFDDNKEELYTKVNGNDGILFTVQKQSTASTSEVSSKINKNIEELTKNNEALTITTLQDQGIYIDFVINSVLKNLVLGGIFAIIILFFFLKNLRPTIIIAVSIPISLLFAIVLMYFSGVTMNIISLGGLALGVGMLVDNSIVVIENIYRLRNLGIPAKEAAVKGAKEVSGAIMASTLTTVSVFLPIVFTEGLSKQLFTDMGLTIAYSLIASLIVALTLVPALSASVLNKTEEKEHKLFDKMVMIYEKALRKALKHKAIVLIVVSVLFVGSTLLSLSKGTVLMPTSDGNQISLTMTMPKGSDKEATKNTSNSIIEKLTSIEDIETIGATEMANSMGSSTGKNQISMYILLKDNKKLTSQEIGKEIKELTKDFDCDIKVQTETMDMSALGGSGVSLKIKGQDLENLKTIAKDLTTVVSEVEGVTNVTNGLDSGNKEVVIIVDKKKAMEKGLTVAQVYQEISMAIKNEATSTNLNVENKEYPIVLVNSEENKVSKDTLKNYEIKIAKEGKEEKVALTDIAKIEEADSLLEINHENQMRIMSVNAEVDRDHNIGLVNKDIEGRLKDYKILDGYTVELGGEKESMDSTFRDLILMISLAIIFIYLIMVAQFQSLLSPFIVLFTIPLAFTGGFLALYLTNFEISMIAMLGFLVLAGIVVNNGIVFVDYVNQLRASGMEKEEALIIAGKTRIRPILMTAFTTILGLVTLALGIGMGADMIQPMAIVTIGGLLYATILTLFVVPSIYAILNREKKKNKV
ncbi:MAG: efflux RND transporter permease subunit [Sarcina sp.]